MFKEITSFKMIMFCCTTVMRSVTRFGILDKDMRKKCASLNNLSLPFCNYPRGLMTHAAHLPSRTHHTEEYQSLNHPFRVKDFVPGLWWEKVASAGI